MTQEQLVEYNKRCAEFLGDEGMQKICSDNRHHYPSIDEMKFDSDWNWIHEVIEAIEKISDWNLECLNVEERLFQMCIPLSNTCITSEDKKEAVVQAINQFLIWYNDNSK